MSPRLPCPTCPADVHRSRQELAALDKERAKLEARLDAKEREINTLGMKARTVDDTRREEVSRARREGEELQKRLLGYERRMVQMQHEIKRKEREYDRLQEQLVRYLADKKRNDSAALAMAGQLTQQVASSLGASGPARAGRSDEGIKAVVAKSFERIHRSNLVGMGVLPLQFRPNDSWQSLELTGNECIDVHPDPELRPQSDALLVITRADGSRMTVTVLLRIDRSLLLANLA